MTPYLLEFLIDPATGEKLTLENPIYDSFGNIESGILNSISGNNYQIIRGVPRFLENLSVKTAAAFGDEWNFFNFEQFKENWLKHVVKNTFGSVNIFKDNIIIDAGCGSGAQAKWFLEYGASHVFLMDLSHSVDDVVKRNLSGVDPTRFDIIQCSIDAPPFMPMSFKGLVYCHNVIQHTPSVEKTANSLYNLLAPGGEFVFNCYSTNDHNLVTWIRFNFIYKPLRFTLRRLPFKLRLLYSRIVASLKILPLIGFLLEKSGFVIQGDVPIIKGESPIKRFKRAFRLSVLNTFDAFGGHTYQWHKSDEEIKSIIYSFEPKPTKILNTAKYFQKPRRPIGCALRIFR
ncbi:class I SAM-dependent methyltransferase [Prochlorococcus marinus]|uniref:class I SAM-dependent methyltransferase n=1 Tax=Prochlorococcus marinus TaxID=1219 RepID=UPI001ADCA781|nr:class I SAM-dependent methyltransferase [Prochlorococcus marinus]MBO8219563.1 class I SAM-dependent methyltransferase [Prochlorococcus marinus CUG1416]MBW3051935.1 hypothetical protein [Prochlorococcus marinus str. MU1416]